MTAKADIDFEKELWDAANELRGAVSENNYKNYILPLVFLKHQYHKNSLDSIAAIKHLLDIAEEFQKDDIRTKELGLTEDELAFYDLLAANEKLLNQAGPIQDLVHKVVASVKKNLQLDWKKKEDAKAAIRLAVKKELRGKVDFSELDRILKEVIEQAEGQYGDWPLVG
jgi:type I restriction enzyme, R subunit